MGLYCFGIDVGGTTVKCGLFQTDGNLVDKWEIPTRTENKGENILPDVAKAIQDKMAEKGDTKGIVRLNYLAMAALGLLFTIVCVAGLLGGSALGETLTAISERFGWIMTGLSTAGGMMRFVGFAVLLKVMMSNEYWGFYFAGFALATIVDKAGLGGQALALIALIGFAIAVYDYQTNVKMKQFGKKEVSNDGI